MAQMIELDGSFGEGGGALVRTALASSMLSQNRSKSKIFEVEGQKLGSRPNILKQSKH